MQSTYLQIKKKFFRCKIGIFRKIHGCERVKRFSHRAGRYSHKIAINEKFVNIITARLFHSIIHERQYGQIVLESGVTILFSSKHVKKSVETFLLLFLIMNFKSIFCNMHFLPNTSNLRKFRHLQTFISMEINFKFLHLPKLYPRTFILEKESIFRRIQIF